jgi:hypothetical protein
MISQWNISANTPIGANLILGGGAHIAPLGTACDMRETTQALGKISASD